MLFVRSRGCMASTRRTLPTSTSAVLESTITKIRPPAPANASKIDVLPAMAAPRGQSTAHRQAKSTAEKRVGRDQRAAPNSRVDPSPDPRAVVSRARPARVRAAVYSPSLSNSPVLPRAVLLAAASIRPRRARGGEFVSRCATGRTFYPPCSIHSVTRTGPALTINTTSHAD